MPQPDVQFHTRLLGAIALMVAIFVVDLCVPTGIAIGVLYLLVILLLVKQSFRVILVTAGVCIGLTLLVPVLVPVASEDWEPLVNRGVAVVAIAAAALTAIRYDFFISLRGDELHLAAGHRLLEEKNKQLEQYMYIASHHLNEPLQTVSSFVNIIEEEEEMTEDMEVYFTFISEATERMREMVLGLLNFSRTGRDETLQRVDLEEQLELVKQNLGPHLKQKNAELYLEEMPVVTGMATELRQLFRELIYNALKFQPKGQSPQIQVSVEEDEFEWTFCVADNGIGIDPDQQARIFDMFTRLHRPEAYPGHGIGLALCEKIVDLHLGKLWVESTPGMGSSFYFTIMKPPA